MKAQESKGGDMVVDSLPLSQNGSLAQIAGLALAGVKGVAVYLGVAKATLVSAIVAAGMGCFPVTLAGAYKHGPSGTVASLKALGFPPGIHVFLDMEGLEAWNTPADELMGLVNATGSGPRGSNPPYTWGFPSPSPPRNCGACGWSSIGVAKAALRTTREL